MFKVIRGLFNNALTFKKSTIQNLGNRRLDFFQKRTDRQMGGYFW